MNRVTLILITIVLTAMVFAKSADSQLIVPTSLSLKVTPTTPTPNTSAVATTILSGSDTSGVNFTWFLNNVRQSDSSGLDRNTFSFFVGDLGTIYTVTVTVSTTRGESLRDSISLTVSDADLTWSAQNFAPAGYEGKVLPSAGTKIIASALPIVFSPGSKTQLNSNNLIYSWFLNDVFDSKNSGVGKHLYKFTLDNASSLKVRIANSQNTVILEKSTDLRTVSPQVLVFLADSDSRIIHRDALTVITGDPGQKLNFIALPYFFNLLPSQLNWSWFVNDQKVSGTPQIPWTANLQIPADIATPAGLQAVVTVLNPYFDAENAQSLISINIR